MWWKSGMHHKSMVHRWLLVLDKWIILFTFLILLTITLTIMLLLLLLLYFCFSGVNTCIYYIIIRICNTVFYLFYTYVYISLIFPQKASNHSMLHLASNELNLPLRVWQQLYHTSCLPPTHTGKLSSLTVALVRRQMAPVNYLSTPCQ